MPEQLDPKDFIITRKRKKYKFAKFHNAENCFEFDEWQQRPVDGIEIGAGTGLFSVELAAREPHKQFVSVDVKADRMQKGAYTALERGITNVYFVRARADQIEQLVPAHSVSEVWVTFPDPYPKKRSAGRRLTHPTYLAKYATVLAPHGAMLLKHDNMDFFTWSLEQLVGTGWHISELSFDLHDSTLSDAYKITTTYEQRWLSEGRTSYFVKAHPA